MTDERSAPIFFFAPFVSSTMRVEPAWIDYNGHLNMAYYHVLFDRAVEEGFGVVGLGQDYLEERAASYFTAEVHVLYKRELKAHDEVRATLQLVDYDEKRLHYYMELRHARDGWNRKVDSIPIGPVEARRLAGSAAVEQADRQRRLQRGA